MATINKVIERTSKLHPDSFDDEQKCRWISELDGKISREVMFKNDFKAYSFPRDGQKELLAKHPYDNIYELYIMAMSDIFSGEIGNYGASAVLFTQAYKEFAKNYIRSNMPPSSSYIIGE